MVDIFANYDEEYEDAKAAVAKARREEEKIRQEFTESKLLMERSERFAQQSSKRAQQAATQESTAKRTAIEARRKLREAGLKGQSKHRWEQQARQAEAEATRAANDARRFVEETRRKEREAKEVGKALAAKNEAVNKIVGVAHAAEQRMKFLAIRPRDTRPSQPAAVEPAETEEELVDVDAAVDQEAPSTEDAALVITPQAVTTLKSTLDTMEHSADQLLRLVVDDEGTLSLYLDTATPTDQIVAHDGSIVMVIGQPVLASLAGAVIDVDEAVNGASLVLTR